MCLAHNCKRLIVLVPILCLSAPVQAKDDAAEGKRSNSCLAGMFISESRRADDGLLGGGIQFGQRWDWIGFDFRFAVAQMGSVPRAVGVLESRSRKSGEIEVFAQKRFWNVGGVFGGVGGVVKEDLVRTWMVINGDLTVQKDTRLSLQPMCRIGFLAGAFEGSTALHFVGHWELLSSVGFTFGR